MIVIPMQLFSAVTGLMTSLGEIHIINDGTGTHQIGHYNVIQHDKNGRVIKKRRLENWPRLAKSPMSLLAAAMRVLGHDAGGDRE